MRICPLAAARKRAASAMHPGAGSEISGRVVEGQMAVLADAHTGHVEVGGGPAEGGFVRVDFDGNAVNNEGG